MYTNKAKGYAQGLLNNAWHFDLRVVMLIMQQLSQLINGDITLLPRQEGYTPLILSAVQSFYDVTVSFRLCCNSVP